MSLKSIRCIASLPLLHRGKRFSNSPVLWFVVSVSLFFLFLTAGEVAPPFLRFLLCNFAIVFLIISIFWLSARVTRSKGIRALSANNCPNCQTNIGMQVSAEAFSDYSRECVDFVERSKGAFSIELDSPVGLECPTCGKGLNFDYTRFDTVHLAEH